MRTIVLLLLLSFATVVSGQPNNFFYPAPKDDVTVHRDIEFKPALLFDLYRPEGTATVPIVIFANIGSPNYRGWGIYIGWAKAVADRGMAAVIYQATQPTAVADFDALISALRQRAGEWNLDPSRVVVWAASANVQVGLPLMMDSRRDYIRGGVLYYGHATVPEIRNDLPVLLVRAGLDTAWINEQIDTMLIQAVKANAPWTIENNAAGYHGFETLNDDGMTRVVIGKTLDFMKNVTDRSVSEAYASAADAASLGGAYSRGEWAKAVDGYRRVVASRPTDGEAHLRLGISLARSGHPAEGLSMIEKAWSLGRTGARDTALPAAEAAARAGNIERTTHWLELVLSTPFGPSLDELRTSEAFAPVRSDPAFVRLLREIEEQRRVAAALTTGPADEAVEVIRTAPSGHRLTRESVLINLGYGALGQRRSAVAIDVFEIATKRYPSSANAWDSLSEAYEAAGRRSDATKAARKALALLGADATLSDAARQNVRRASEERLARLEVK